MRLAKKCAILHDQAGECVPSLCKMRHQCNEATKSIGNFQQTLKYLFRYGYTEFPAWRLWTGFYIRQDISIHEILQRVALKLKEK